MSLNNVSRATLGRLPGYLEYLKSLPASTSTISSTAIAKGLSLGDVQVRKDLAAISGKGRPKTGYDKEKLINDIESHLGHEELTEAILVGAGKLGRALLDYGGFEEYGVRIVAAFDCNEEPMYIGKSEKPVLPIRHLGDFCREHGIRLGIITTGQGSAEEVLKRMVESGIKAVWNFAPVSLHAPHPVVIRQENLALSLAYLKNQIVK